MDQGQQAGKLRFKVVSVTGEDPDHPATELLAHSHTTRGWCTPKFASYPQDVVLMFEGPVRIHQLQVLSHQSRVASRIELTSGSFPTSWTPDHLSSFIRAHRLDSVAPEVPPEFPVHVLSWRPLGYFSLQNNEASAHKAREIKTVTLDAPAHFLRFRILGCHVVPVNFCNQACIIAMNFVGSLLNPGARLFDASVSAPMDISRSIMAPNAVDPVDDIAFDMTFDPATAAKMKQYQLEKEAAVAEERYDVAKQYKAAINYLKTVGVELGKLELRKQTAVGNEDYDTAQELKERIEGVRNRADEFVSSLHIPGHQTRPAAGRQPPPQQQPSVLQRARSPIAQSMGPPQPLDRHEDPANGKVPSPTAAVQATSPPSGSSIPVSSPSSSALLSPPTNSTPPSIAKSSPPANNPSPPAAAKPAAAARSPPSPKTPVAPPPSMDLDALGPDSNPFVSKSRLTEDTPLRAPSSLPPESPPGGEEGERPFDPLDIANQPKKKKGPPIKRTPIKKKPAPGGATGSPGKVKATPRPGKKSVPDFDNDSPPDLPKPEPISENDRPDLEHLIDAFGEETVARLVSKASWALREQAAKSVASTVRSKGPSGGLGAPTKDVMTRLMKEKVTHVFCAAPDVAVACAEALPSGEVNGVVSAFLPGALVKMGDTNKKTAGLFRDAVHALAAASTPGPGPVATATMKLPATKAAPPPKAVQARLELLKYLVETYEGVNALTPSALGNFLTSGLSSPNAGVRGAAMDVACALFTQHGGAVHKHLSKAPPKTLETLQGRFAAINPNDAAPAAAAPPPVKAPTKAPAKSTPTRAGAGGAGKKAAGTPVRRAGGVGATTPGGKKKTTPARGGRAPATPTVRSPTPEDLEESVLVAEDGLCALCGKQDDGFSDPVQFEAHYLKYCPMLTVCESCDEVVEVSALSEHALTECDAADGVKECSKCLEPIPVSEYASHVRRAKCKTFDPNKPTCPLCHDSLPPSEDPWVEHLAKGKCKASARSQAIAKEAKAASKGRSKLGKLFGRARSRSRSASPAPQPMVRRASGIPVRRK